MRGFGAEHSKGKVIDQDADSDYEDDEDLYHIRWDSERREGAELTIAL
jgi:hypothetical protein